MSENIEEKKTVFVVLRDKKRVSDSEYKTYKEAQYEYKYWDNIVRNWCGYTKITIGEIVPYRWRGKPDGKEKSKTETS